MDSDTVGFRIFEKAHGLYIRDFLKQSLADAIDPVHDAAVAREDDRKRSIAIEHQARIINDLATVSR